MVASAAAWTLSVSPHSRRMHLPRLTLLRCRAGTNPSGAVRIIARMNTRADRKSSGSGEFKSRKDQAESMAAERSANAEIEMAAALETMKTERALAA